MSEKEREFWETAISKVDRNQILIHGFPIEDLIDSCSFGDMVYLVFMGELPAREEGRLIEAILVSSVDHGLLAPSVNAARFVASCGVPLQAAVASGINAIGDIHGGSIEAAARFLQETAHQKKQSIEEIAEALLLRFKVSKERVPGLGHPLHEHDPRSAKLLSVARQLGHYGHHCELVSAMSQLSRKHFQRHLPVNVDGAIAAIISDLGIHWQYGKGFFIIARCVGLTAHVFEEMRTCPPFRKVPT